MLHSAATLRDKCAQWGQARQASCTRGLGEGCTPEAQVDADMHVTPQYWMTLRVSERTRENLKATAHRSDLCALASPIREAESAFGK